MFNPSDNSIQESHQHHEMHLMPEGKKNRSIDNQSPKNKDPISRDDPKPITLCLNYNSHTKQFCLQVCDDQSKEISDNGNTEKSSNSDNDALTEISSDSKDATLNEKPSDSNDATSNEKSSDSKDATLSSPNEKYENYCIICKSPVCKYEDIKKVNISKDDKTVNISKDDAKQLQKYDAEQPEEVQVKEGANKSEIIQIHIDKSEICGTICDQSAVSQRDKVDVPDWKSSTGKVDDSNEDQYCPMCDAPKCKFAKKTRKDSFKNTIKSEGLKKGQSEFVTITIDKSEICGDICGQPATLQKGEGDVSKENTYCPVCDAPECRFAKIPNATDNFNKSNTDNDNKSSNNISNQSEIVTMIVDKSEICSNICRQADISANEKEDISKDDEYCPVCDAPKCKFANRPKIL